MKIEYPPAPMAWDTRIEWEQKSLNPWRMAMKRRLLDRRGWQCERCGAKGPDVVFDLDECCVPRCDMGGFSLEQRRIAFGEPNLAIVCAECNRTMHDRDGAWGRAVARYGEDVMKGWYAELNLKCPRIGWMP